MESNGVTSFRSRNSPSSDRFLGLFSQSQHENPNGDMTGDELNEDDVFWTGNFSVSDHRSDTPDTSVNHQFSSVRRVDSSGILAALPGGENRKKFIGDNRLLYRKISFPSSSSSSSSSRMIPAIPKSQLSNEGDYSGNFRHSAPVNVPVRKKREVKVCDEVSDEDDESDKEMLPPHEIVAKSSGQSDMTFSVLEGVGRTLKGRDLRQVDSELIPKVKKKVEKVLSPSIILI